MNLTNHLQTAVWSPWILFLWARYRGRRSRRALALLPLALALQVLGGSPEIVLMTLSILAAATLADSALRWKARARLVTVLAGVVGAAVCICAFQLLPTIEYLRQSVRDAGLSNDEVTLWSLQPVSLLQLLLPHSWNPAISGADIAPLFERRVPWIQSLYLGLSPLCLAIAGAAFGRERRLWGGLIVVAIVLALGRYTPIFPMALNLFPSVFGRFRFPEKFFFVVHLAAVVLAAEGAELVLRRESRAQRLALVAAGTFAAAASMLLLVKWLRPQDYLWLLIVLRGGGFAAEDMVKLALDVAFKSERLLLIIATFAMLFWLRRKSLLGEGLFATTLIALVAADLSSAHFGLNSTISWSGLMREPLLVDLSSARAKDQYVFHYQTTAVRATDGPPEPIAGFEQWLPPIESKTFAETATRFWRAFALNQGMIHGIRDVGGGDGFNPSSLVLLDTMLSILPREKAIGLLRIYGVAYLIGPTALDESGLERLDQVEPALDHAYRIVDPLPSAYLVGRLHAVGSDVGAINLLIRPDFRPRQEAAVSQLPDDWLDADTPSPGTIESIARGNDWVRIEVFANRQAFLVLNDSYFPGWEARVDGAPTTIYRTNAIVRGLVVPPGRHTLDIAYRPASFRIGASVSIAFLIVSLTAFAVAALREKSARAARRPGELRPASAEES